MKSLLKRVRKPPVLWGLIFCLPSLSSVGNIGPYVLFDKIIGMVNATEDSYSEHPQVINGCSELFKDIWGR